MELSLERPRPTAAQSERADFDRRLTNDDAVMRDGYAPT